MGGDSPGVIYHRMPARRHCMYYVTHPHCGIRLVKTMHGCIDANRIDRGLISQIWSCSCYSPEESKPTCHACWIDVYVDTYSRNANYKTRQTIMPAPTSWHSGLFNADSGATFMAHTRMQKTALCSQNGRSDWLCDQARQHRLRVPITHHVNGIQYIS